MARFQAMTNAVLDEELETIRVRLGLATSQRADLLREMAAIAGWVLRQVAGGRSVEARSGSVSEPLDHPAFERLRGASLAGERVVLYGGEADRLAEILDRPFHPTPALRKALGNLAASPRLAPKVRWRKKTSKRRSS
jgi:hypothetical protein